MNFRDRATARRNIDKKLRPFADDTALIRPPKGWIKAIREALGMTTRQLAKRVDVSQSRVVAIEKAEITGSITLDSLDRAARALNCRLVYTLVPITSLDQMVNDRALKLAANRLQSVSHTMALEDQRVETDTEQDQVRELAKKLLEKPGSTLWEDEWNDRTN